MKILLVDDNRMLRDALFNAFRKKGCFLLAVGTAEDGLRALKKDRFDIIISDLQLPGINGLEFFRQAIAYQPETARILISGDADPGAVSRAYEIGVHAFLEKPFSFQALLKVLNLLIEKRDSPERPRDNKTNRPAKIVHPGKSDTSAQTAMHSRYFCCELDGYA